MNPMIKKSLLASSIALALSTSVAQATLVTGVLGANTWSTDSANFTVLASNGGVVGGANEVKMAWDGTAYTASSDYVGPNGVWHANDYYDSHGFLRRDWVLDDPDSNVTLNSTAPFFGYSWTAHDIQMFLPGSYSFDVTLGGGNPEIGSLSATVGAGQLGMHMLFDWGGSLNVDVFMVFAQNSIFGSGLLYYTSGYIYGPYGNWQSTCNASYTGTITKNCLFDGGYGYGSAGAPVKNEVWMLASTDPDGDGVMGIRMAAGGPFAGFNWNLNANLTPSAVPVPAAAWLFGSGFLALIGVARRRK